MNILLDTWATTMWRACWQGGLVVLVVWLICRLLPSMPARFQCWLWRLAILKFMLVLLLPCFLNVPLLPAPSVAKHDLQAATAMPVALEIPAATESPFRPTDHREGTPSRANDQIKATDQITATNQSKVSDQITTISLPSVREILGFAWIIGVGWGLIRLLAALYGTMRLRKQGHSIACTSLTDELTIQGRLFGIRSLPRVLEVVGDGSPMLIGVLRPAIVIPTKTLARLNASEQMMVLGHELGHIKRADLLWGLAAAIVRAVFFFHPLVWLSERQLKLTQEVAADELAISQQRQDPASYGKLLVSVVSKLGPTRLLSPMSMGTAGSVKSLKRRLGAMRSFGQVSRRLVVISALLLAGVVIVGLVPWRLVAAEPKKETKDEHDVTATNPPQQPTASTPYLSAPYSSTPEIYVPPQASAPSPPLQTKQAKAPPSRAHEDAFDAEMLKAVTALRKELTLLQTEITKLGGFVLVEPIAGSAIEDQSGELGFCPAKPHKPVKLMVMVYLMQSKVTDADLKRLEGLMTRCNYLSLTATRVTDAGLRHLEGLPNLQVLYLRRTNITDAGLKHLQGLNQLVEVDLFDTDVTDRGLECLKGLTALQSLNLGATQITDDGLGNLEGMKQLRVLDLFGTQVSKDGLKHLKGLTELKRVSVERTGIDILEVWNVLPECQGYQHGGIDIDLLLH